MAHFKGTVFESTRLFTVREFGEEGLERVLAELSADDRDVLRALHAIGWCPVEPVLNFHHALDRVFGHGDLELCVKAGHFSAGWSFNTILKMFVRFRSPAWLIERATSVWGRYHDTGRWQIDAISPTRIQGEICDFAVRDPAFCARLRGWLQGAVELTGGQRVQVSETRCACNGHGHCSFLLTWEGA
jgi:V4R domain-containing protein